MGTSVRELLAGVGQQMRIDFESITSQLDHMGERGQARESVLRTFLEHYLPHRVGVSHGTIIDCKGGTARQSDVILYDRDATPVLRIADGSQLFPCETVLMSIEVKSYLDRRELVDSLTKCASIAGLQEVGGSEPEPMIGGIALSGILRPPSFHVSFRPSPPLAAIFAFDSDRIDTVATNLMELVEFRPRGSWPAFVVSLNKGVLVWSELDIPAKNSRMLLGSVRQNSLTILRPEHDHPLLPFYQLLMLAAQSHLAVRPDLAEYIRLSGSLSAIPFPDDFGSAVSGRDLEAPRTDASIA